MNKLSTKAIKFGNHVFNLTMVYGDYLLSTLELSHAVGVKNADIVKSIKALEDGKYGITSGLRMEPIVLTYVDSYCNIKEYMMIDSLTIHIVICELSISEDIKTELINIFSIDHNDTDVKWKRKYIPISVKHRMDADMIKSYR